MNINQINVEYVISFSDAFFAFSIIVLSIQLPNFPSNIAEPEFTKRLFQLIVPNIIHYVISFMVVGMYWIAYHRIFEHIRRAYITLLWLNLLFLLFISLVAYFSGLLSTYNIHRIVVISFASILTTAGLTLYIIWWYSTHNRQLVDNNIIQI
ncbi:MAG TPA: TMEM175 family protein [Nitrososphaeraceae archaeon]|nr:TMEM175 family protein [Nitrososphaeraceae archaeon]